MKLRIRGNSVRLRVSQTELARLAETGVAEDLIRFAPSKELRYGIAVQAAGQVAAEFRADGIRVSVPQARFDRWLEPDEVAITAEQPVGDGGVLTILVEKDYTCLAPRSGEDDADLFPNPAVGGVAG